MPVLSLYFPRLPTDLVRRRSRVDTRSAVLLSRVDHQREIVAACCHLAEHAGARTGMTIAQAKALVRAPIYHEPFDSALISKALLWLAVHMHAFTPRVSVNAPDGLCLDITGCSHLFRSEERMLRRVVSNSRDRGFDTAAAIAPWPAAAWALARFGKSGTRLHDRVDVVRELEPLPLAAARLTDEQQLAMHQVGVTTIGEVLHVPRAELARRFGADVPRRLDLLLGRATETFTPVRTRPPLSVGRMFAGPTDQTESITLCVRQLLDAVAQRLTKREAGCREMLVTLLRSDLPPVELSARASRPTRDPKHWFALLRPQLEKAHLGFGVEGVIITARSVRTLRHVQTARWMESTGATDSGELARLADTLIARLGPNNVFRMHTRASHLPERTATLASAEHESTSIVTQADLCTPSVDRPSLLYTHPIPIDVVFLFPDGPIGSLRRDGVSRAVMRCRGPERIGAEWWRIGDAGHATRDYYQLQTDDGAWLWAFRCVESHRWFLHGEWA